MNIKKIDRNVNRVIVHFIIFTKESGNFSLNLNSHLGNFPNKSKKNQRYTVAQKNAPMFACYGKTHALLNDYIR